MNLFLFFFRGGVSSRRPPALLVFACAPLSETHPCALVRIPGFLRRVFTRRRVENINWRQSISSSTPPPNPAGLRLRKAGFPLRKCCSSPLSVNTGKETQKKKKKNRRTAKETSPRLSLSTVNKPGVHIVHCHPSIHPPTFLCVHMCVFMEMDPKRTNTPPF